MQQTEYEALRSIDVFLRDMFYAVEIIPDLKELAIAVTRRVLNYCQHKGIDPKKITFGDIKWRPFDGLWMIEPLQADETESLIAVVPEFEKIKWTMEDLPEIANLIKAIGSQMTQMVRRHKVDGRKIKFSKVVWDQNNRILFRAYRQLKNGRMDPIKPEEIKL